MVGQFNFGDFAHFYIGGNTCLRVLSFGVLWTWFPRVLLSQWTVGKEKPPPSCMEAGGLALPDDVGYLA